MNVLKGLLLSLLSFLLFLSLAVFGIAFTLNSTLLNPEFVSAEVDKLDLSVIVSELVEEQIMGQLPPEAAFLKEDIQSIIADFEPQIKEQADAAIYSSYDFLLGKSERLSLVISLEPMKETLRDKLKQALLQNLPPELAAAPPEMVEQYFDQYYQQFAGQIPSSFEFGESDIPPETMAQIMQARQYISYLQTGYYALMGFMVLLVLAIIFIQRDVRRITRGLGTTLLIYGAIEFAGLYVARNYLPTSLPLDQIPSSLQMWALGLVSDVLAPLQAFSLGMLIGGVVLLVVSFVYRSRAAAD